MLLLLLLMMMMMIFILLTHSINVIVELLILSECIYYDVRIWLPVVIDVKIAKLSVNFTASGQLSVITDQAKHCPSCRMLTVTPYLVTRPSAISAGTNNYCPIFDTFISPWTAHARRVDRKMREGQSSHLNRLVRVVEIAREAVVLVELHGYINEVPGNCESFKNAVYGMQKSI